jgi:hypothetical protein
MWPWDAELCVVQNLQTFVDAGLVPGYSGLRGYGVGDVGLGGLTGSLLHLICNLGDILRISMYGRSDLLSPLYAAFACTGDL